MPDKKAIFDKKNVLVTGGAGFIGSHLCEALLQKNNRVVCVDNFITSRELNIDLLLQDPNFQFIKADINDPLDLETFAELEAFKIPFQGIQEIYHLACPTSVKEFDKYKLQTLRANSRGTENMLDMAVKYGAKFVLASSSVVYGDRLEEKQVFEEEYNGVVEHLTPRGCYDEGKRFAETAVETYRQMHDLDAKIARVFRTYGPKMRLFDGHMIPDFILHALEGKPLEIYGDETFRTSLCYVSDIVDGLTRLMKAPPETKLVNLGSPDDLRIVDVAQKVIEMTGSSSKVEHKQEFKFLTELGLPSIKRAKSELGWLPLVRLEDGLQRTIDYVKANKMLLTL